MINTQKNCNTQDKIEANRLYLPTLNGRRHLFFAIEIIPQGAI